MFSQASVILSTMGGLPPEDSASWGGGGVFPRRQTGGRPLEEVDIRNQPRRQPPSPEGRHPPWEYGQCAVSMYATGMHSSFLV